MGTVTRFNLRQKPRISYYEPDEPNLDEYIFCDGCGDYVYEYCSIHGPLLVIPDDKVSSKPNFPSFVPRAALTIPDVFLHIARSDIPGAGLGVFATLTLPRGVRFGPYRGKRSPEPESNYCWQIYDGNNRRSHVIDAGDASQSNWLRYVNCSRNFAEQNLLAYQYQGELYYRTIKIIPRFTELLVFYGSEFANFLGVDLRQYNSSQCGHGTGIPSSAKKAKLDTDIQTVSEEKEKPHEIAEDKQEKLQVSNETNKKNVKRSGKANDKKKTDLKNSKTKIVSKKSDPEYFVPSANIEKGNDNERLQNVTNTNENITKTNSASNLEVDLNKDDISNTDILKKLFQFSCDKCSFTTNNKNFFKAHLSAHASQKCLSCDLCPYITIHKNSLQYHLQVIHNIGSKSYNCNTCLKSFGSNSDLQRHLLIHEGIKPHKCDICKKSFTDRSALKSHLLIHEGIKPHKCDICNKSFTLKSNLKSHLLKHEGTKPHKCDICKKSFTHKCSLKTHLLIHEEIKPHKCDICKKSFTKNDNLKTHLLIHEGIKPHKCDICKKSFTQMSNLKTHLLLHEGIKPHKCDICKKSFTHKSSLKTHLLIHKEIKPHKCDVCQKSYFDKRCLKNHLLKH